MAATAGVVALSLAGETEPAVALLPLSIGAIYLGGAVRGNSNVNKCRRAMGEYESYAAARGTPSGGEQPTLEDDNPEQEQVRELERRDQLARRAAQAPVQPPQAPGMAPVPPPVQAPVPVATAPAQAPAAAPASAPAQPPQQKAKQAPKLAPQDDWSDFWREVE